MLSGGTHYGSEKGRSLLSDVCFLLFYTIVPASDPVGYLLDKAGRLYFPGCFRSNHRK